MLTDRGVALRSSRWNYYMSVEMKDERLILMVIRTLVEEWGADQVVISVPRRWASHISAGYLGSVRLSFDQDRDSITVRAGTSVKRSFKLQVVST